MKNKRSSILLFMMFSIMILLIGIIVALNILFQERKDWLDLLFGLMGDLLSAIIIGLFLGLITKIITNRLFSIELNMKKLRDFGIQGIGTGKSNDSDIRRMFGTSLPKKRYPHEIKLLFLTGNVFLRVFKKQIIKCLDEGSKIYLLIASPEPENTEYLKRCSFRFSEEKIDYVDEIYFDSLKTVQEIKKETKNPENFKVRFYLDEYQNNIRISRYCFDSEKEKTYYWINVQPLSKPAIDLSIALKGVVETDYSLDEIRVDDKDICQVSEIGFNKLWEKYKNTEYILDKVPSDSKVLDLNCV